jgi:TonB family protein
MNYQEENNYPKALAWSTGVMALIILASWLIIFGTNPPPEELGTGGILVNYGTAPEGMGDDFTSAEEPSVAPNANNTPPDKVVESQPEETTPSSETSDKAVVTQDLDDAPAVTTSVKKTNTAPSTSPTTKVTKPTINENALYKGKKNNGTGQGDGTGNTPGNQGDPDGSTLAPNYGEGGSGFGSARLANRTSVIKPQVDGTRQANGKIVITIRVDKDGSVVDARVGKGTTIPDYQLQQKCLRAVREARFNRSETAPDIQEGSFVFNFKAD